MRRPISLALLPSLIALAAASAAATPGVAAAAPSAPACQLGNGVQHVIYVQFDNVHLRRDAAAVPSDLEQMPNLLNFIEQNGVMMNKHYTPLIAHTADDIVTSESGLYGDQQGIPEANSYGFYKPDGSVSFTSSFKYWTDKISDGTYNNLSADGQNTPGPWTPFTLAGCNSGDVAVANTALENSTSDVRAVYGANSPQAHDPQAFAHYEGIAVHCALGSPLCSPANGGVADVLPSMPSYAGHQALFGARYVTPQVGGTGTDGQDLNDFDGNLIADNFNGVTTPGFPGFDGMTAPVSLAYTLALQTHGVPVTETYIAAAHVDPATGNDAGPGQAGYEQRLQDYDRAFGTFFARLAEAGITPQNSLFVISSDENDQFVGGAGSPAGCDGVNVTCTYNQIGEVDVNLQKLLAQHGVNTPFSIHFDSAPYVYLPGDPAAGSGSMRDFERANADLVVHNPVTGQDEKLFNYFADPTELRLLHMTTADPKRTPSFTAFGKSSYYITTTDPDCGTQVVVECDPSFGEDAWMHGTFDRQINQSWLGLAGPGVRSQGLDDQTFSDHADILPTMLFATGLKPTYAMEGVPITQAFTGVRQAGLLRQLGEAYRSINAPLGALAQASLKYSTAGIVSTSPGDSTYNQHEANLASITSDRNAMASKLSAELSGAEFQGQSLDPDTVNRQVAEAQALVDRMQSQAG